MEPRKAQRSCARSSPCAARHRPAAVTALYLDGISLPEQVYAELDFDGVLADIEQALAQASPALHDTWMGPEETALYFFGSDAEDMCKRAAATLRRNPVCQNARVVLRHGHPSLPRREVRLPRH